MSKPDLMKIQTCVLKVNIHCDGCEQKVKKLLQKIDGVYSVKVDANDGKVVVAGDVDPAKLVKKLKRAGKHAEIWGGGQTGMMYNQNYPINPQFQNLQIDNGKGKDNNNKSQNQKGHKGNGAGGGQGQKQQLAQFQNMKGVQDLKVPAKDHNIKSVKFNFPEEEFDASDDDGFDEYDDNFDDYNDEEEEEALGHGHGHVHGHPMHQNKMMPMMRDGRGPHGPPASMNGPAIINHKGNVGGSRNDNNNNGSVKKGDVIDQAMLIQGKGGNFNKDQAMLVQGKGGNFNKDLAMLIQDKGGNFNNTKNDTNGGKKSDQKGEKLNKKGNKPNKGGGEGGDAIKKKKGKSEKGLLGRFLGFGKKKKEVEFEDLTYTNKSKNQNSVGGDNKDKEGKKGEGKLEAQIKNSKLDLDFDFDDYDDIDNTPPHHKNGKASKGSSNGKEGQMDPSPIVGNNPMSRQMENIPKVQGLPAMNGGYYQGMQMPQPSYNNNNNNLQQQQQQQYMAMMMNQQGNMNNNMYPNAMMYDRPYPYMPPPPMPSHPMSDPFTHTFSDENVESCNIM